MKILTNPRDRGEETHMADLPPYPSIPRWLKVSVIVIAVVVVLVVVLMLTGVLGGVHGPGQRGPGGH
ncbi:MAG: hypothetical protein H0T74_14695 [Rubrobacteraceae bacterium]|jgi:hypothetical protein|nr:hypothetical protein [Rubrobacteraceae bacterium]